MAEEKTQKFKTWPRKVRGRFDRTVIESHCDPHCSQVTFFIGELLCPKSPGFSNREAQSGYFRSIASGMRQVLHLYILFRDTDVARLAAYRAPVVDTNMTSHLDFLCIALTHDALRVPSIKSLHAYPPLSLSFFKLSFTAAGVLGLQGRNSLHQVLVHGLRGFSARAHGRNNGSGSGDDVAARVDAFYARAARFLIGDDVHAFVDQEVLCALRDERVGFGAQRNDGDIDGDREIRSLDGFRRSPSGRVQLA